MFAQVIRPNYFRPMVARPIIAHGCRLPVPVQISPFAMAMPVCCPRPFVPMPTFNPFMAMATAPIAMANPFFAAGNVFIQNMRNIAAAYVNRVKQQNQFLSTFKPNLSNYKFGSLTTGVSQFSYNRFSNIGTSTQNLSFWERLGYCASSGLRLARTAVQRAVGFTGFCARYVKNAIAAAGLGKYVNGNAHEMVRILRANKNFKEIPVSSVDPKKLPAGCILVYGKGKGGYSKRYGHTEITTGTGRAVSDGITNNIKPGLTAVFIPVA